MCEIFALSESTLAKIDINMSKTSIVSKLSKSILSSVEPESFSNVVVDILVDDSLLSILREFHICVSLPIRPSISKVHEVPLLDLIFVFNVLHHIGISSTVEVSVAVSREVKDSTIGCANPK